MAVKNPKNQNMKLRRSNDNNNTCPKVLDEVLPNKDEVLPNKELLAKKNNKNTYIKLSHFL